MGGEATGCSTTIILSKQLKGWNEEKIELWKRINEFSFEDDKKNVIEFSFLQRLAKENNWRISKAKRAIEEYRKFLFLCSVEGNCTPSDDVDQVWHLHLQYTKNYWEVLCETVLKKKLHHIPTTGGVQQKNLFANQYQKTCEKYEDYFGDISKEFWPKVETYSSQKLTYDSSRYFLFRKSLLFPLLLLFSFLIVANLGTIFFAYHCSTDTDNNNNDNEVENRDFISSIWSNFLLDKKITNNNAKEEYEINDQITNKFPEYLTVFSSTSMVLSVISMIVLIIVFIAIITMIIINCTEKSDGGDGGDGGGGGGGGCGGGCGGGGCGG